MITRITSDNGSLQNGPMAWAAALQAAVYNGISGKDMGEIMAAIVAKAKKGDLKAAEFLLKYTIGGPAMEVHQKHLVVRADLDGEQSHAIRERRKRLPQLAARAANGEPLFSEKEPRR